MSFRLEESIAEELKDHSTDELFSAKTEINKTNGVRASFFFTGLSKVYNLSLQKNISSIYPFNCNIHHWQSTLLTFLFWHTNVRNKCSRDDYIYYTNYWFFFGVFQFSFLVLYVSMIFPEDTFPLKNLEN